MFRRARDYFNLIGETVPPNSSRKEAKAQIRKSISTKPRTDRAIKLAGNVAFERWYDNNNDAEQSAGDDCNRNDASTTKNPNPPLRLLRQSAGPHMCIKCASTVDVKDVQQNDDFRLALQARLSLGDPDQVSSSNLSTVENNQELSLSRSVVLERGVHYAEALSMYQPGTNANQEANEEHPNIGPESKVPNRLDPQAFPLYMLACDHIICRACLLYNFSWWHQNAVCPMCQHELVKTGHFYYRNMMADKTTVLALPSEDSSLDDKLFHKAMDVHNAFVKANDKPFIILTTWACELLAHIVAEHLMTQYQEGGSGHSSKDMTHEALSQSVQSSSVKHVLEIASETLHISFQKLFRLHAKDVPFNAQISPPKFPGAKPRSFTSAAMNAEAYLRKQGWQGSGHSLDHTGRGIKKPLLITHKNDQLGLGKKKAAHTTDDQWWLRAYDQSLQTIGTGKDSTLDQVRTQGINRGGLYGFFVKGEQIEGTIEDTSATTTDASNPPSGTTTPPTSASETEASAPSKKTTDRKSKRKREDADAKASKKGKKGDAKATEQDVVAKKLSKLKPAERTDYEARAAAKGQSLEQYVLRRIQKKTEKNASESVGPTSVPGVFFTDLEGNPDLANAVAAKQPKEKKQPKSGEKSEKAPKDKKLMKSEKKEKKEKKTEKKE
ncbi:zf-RING-2 domain containing protein [Pyrenophora teres f. maculata]|nr:zf-RING-2 domain containing protein [Pyrenophora teres f. maculata]